MANLKVFISSTCYDLSLLRFEMRDFIVSMGYEPVMSDYADILYDPRTHTHSSCVNEVENCDMLVVIIGSRFGGEGVPEALNLINLDDFDYDDVPDDRKFSITQLEVLKAINNRIPVYTFIDSGVYHDHLVYEKNKDNATVIYPSIEKQETANYIFDFINYIRKKESGNYIFEFKNIQDIEVVLKKQWAGYFQRLIHEQRYQLMEQKRTNQLNEQFEDLKAAVLTSIENNDRREVANGVIKFRRLAELFYCLEIRPDYYLDSEDSFDELLSKHSIANIVNSRDYETAETNRNSYIPNRTYLVKENNTYYESRYPKDIIYGLSLDWENFKSLQKNSKQLILETLFDNQMFGRGIRYVNNDIKNVIPNYDA